MTTSEPRGSGYGGHLAPSGEETVTRASTRMTVVTLLVVFFVAYLIRAVLWPFVIAGVLAFVATPAIEAVSRRLRLPRIAVAATVFVIIIGAVATLLTLALPSLVMEAKDTIVHLHAILTRGFEEALGAGSIHLLGGDTNAESLATQSVTAIRNALGQADLGGMIVLQGVTGLLGLVLTVTLLFFGLSSGPQIVRSLLWLVPPAQRPLVDGMRAQLHPILLRYFVGLGIVVLYATAASWLGLGLFLHIKSALLLAIITGLCEVVPVIGPAAAIVIAGLAALRGAAGIGDMAAYAVYAVVLRLSIDQLVSPLVLGRAGRVHPVLIIFCFLAGGALFGIVGLILAVPVALTIRTVLATLYDEPAYDPQG